MADALAQVAGQLERLGAASGESRVSIDAVGEGLEVVSSRLDGLELPPPVDLTPVTDAVIRVATLVEELTERLVDRCLRPAAPRVPPGLRLSPPNSARSACVMTDGFGLQP